MVALADGTLAIFHRGVGKDSSASGNLGIFNSSQERNVPFTCFDYVFPNDLSLGCHEKYFLLFLLQIQVLFLHCCGAFMEYFLTLKWRMG